MKRQKKQKIVGRGEFGRTAKAAVFPVKQPLVEMDGVLQ